MHSFHDMQIISMMMNFHTYLNLYTFLLFIPFCLLSATLC